jgi:hypothetical protein
MPMTIRGEKFGTGGMVAEAAMSGAIPAATLVQSLILGGLLLLIGP